MLDGLQSKLLSHLVNAWGEYPARILIKVQENVNTPFGLDMTIEGLSKQRYSVFIFIFLIMQIILFTFIIYVYIKKTKAMLKTGEKIMFGAIGMGIVIGVAIGWTQLIEGYLF